MASISANFPQQAASQKLDIPELNLRVAVGAHAKVPQLTIKAKRPFQKLVEINIGKYCVLPDTTVVELSAVEGLPAQLNPDATLTDIHVLLHDGVVIAHPKPVLQSGANVPKCYVVKDQFINEYTEFDERPPTPSTLLEAFQLTRYSTPKSPWNTNLFVALVTDNLRESPLSLVTYPRARRILRRWKLPKPVEWFDPKDSHICICASEHPDSWQWILRFVKAHNLARYDVEALASDPHALVPFRMTTATNIWDHREMTIAEIDTPQHVARATSFDNAAKFPENPFYLRPRPTTPPIPPLQIVWFQSKLTPTAVALIQLLVRANIRVTHLPEPDVVQVTTPATVIHSHDLSLEIKGPVHSIVTASPPSGTPIKHSHDEWHLI